MPWCPVCKEEYSPGVAQCYDCGVALTDVPPPAPVVKTDGYAFGQAEPSWPKDASGQPEEGAKVIFAENVTDVSLASSLLTAYGVPIRLQHPNGAFFSTVIFGKPILGSSIYVPVSRLEEAQDLLTSTPVEEA